MSVHEIKRASLLDIPAKLRELADEFERRPEQLKTAIVIIGGYEGGFCSVRGYGERSSALESTGWLHRGLDVLTSGSAIDDIYAPKVTP